MILLNPIWLWGLGGLAIPIAIHLLSRKEGKTIRIGSIRFLTETSTSKFSSIRLNELSLLAVRSLLIILLVLFLTSLLIPSSDGDSTQKWLVIEKGLEQNEQIKRLSDSLQKDGYEIRRLSKSFPLPEDDTSTQSPDYYKLNEELSYQKNTQAVVIAGNALSGFKGKRISLPDHITWLSYPVLTENSPVDSLAKAGTLRITVAYDKEFQYDRKIMIAALRALQASTPAKIVIEETDVANLKSSNSDWLFWLSASGGHYKGKLLRFKGDLTSDLLVQENKNQWILTKRLDEENAIDQHLAVQLMNMLFHEEFNQEIRKNDKRTLSNELAWLKPNKSQSANIKEAGATADKILILIIALLFITERILAFYRKQ